MIVLEVIESINSPVHNEANAAHGDPNQECQCPLPELCQCIVLLCPVYLELLLYVVFLHGMTHEASVALFAYPSTKNARLKAVTTTDSRLMMFPRGDEWNSTAGSKSWDSKPAMRLRRASTSLLSAAVVGAPCTVEGIGPAPASCCKVAVLNLSPRVGSSSSKSRWDLLNRGPRADN